MKNHIVHCFFFYINKKISIQKGREIKRMLNVKQIVHYQVRQENVILFIYLFNNGRENIKR